MPHSDRPRNRDAEDTENESRVTDDDDDRDDDDLDEEEEGAMTANTRGDFQRASLLGAGLLIGAVLGASVALLLAPRTGAQTRTLLKRRASRVKHRAADALDTVTDEIRSAAHRGSREARRAMHRARKAALEALDR
jgi:gas vesicle protein